ncbi:MAG: pilus assembly protein PilZ [Tardiphaga sp.]|nr:pilus assembly protein PilZ [Tardiphaga sp.]
MDDRRKDMRDKVIFGGIASHEATPPRDCVVRDISDHGARLEFKSGARLPKDQISLAIARRGRSFLAKIIWWRDNIVGVAFTDPADQVPESDLAERLRKSEKKKRQLQRKINDLLGH